MRQKIRIHLGTDEDGRHPDVTIDCMPPFADVNTVFRAASQALLEPHQLAIQLDKMSEEGAERLYAMVYAEGVILSSPTEGFTGFSRQDWKAWLIEHPVHFQNLREICDYRKNWEEPGDEPGGAGDGGTEAAEPEKGHPDAGAPPQ